MTNAEIMKRQAAITDKRLVIQSIKKILKNPELEAEAIIAFQESLDILEGELKILLEPFTF